MESTYSLVSLSIDLIVSDPYDPFIFNCYILEGLTLYDFIRNLRELYSESFPDFTVIVRRYSDDEFCYSDLYSLRSFADRYSVFPVKKKPLLPRFVANHFCCPYGKSYACFCDNPCARFCPLVLRTLPSCRHPRTSEQPKPDTKTDTCVKDGSSQQTQPP